MEREAAATGVGRPLLQQVQGPQQHPQPEQRQRSQQLMAGRELQQGPQQHPQPEQRQRSQQLMADRELQQQLQQQPPASGHVDQRHLVVPQVGPQSGAQVPPPPPPLSLADSQRCLQEMAGLRLKLLQQLRGQQQHTQPQSRQQPQQLMADGEQHQQSQQQPPGLGHLDSHHLAVTQIGLQSGAQLPAPLPPLSLADFQRHLLEAQQVSLQLQQSWDTDVARSVTAPQQHIQQVQPATLPGLLLQAPPLMRGPHVDYATSRQPAGPHQLGAPAADQLQQHFMFTAEPVAGNSRATTRIRNPPQPHMLMAATYARDFAGRKQRRAAAGVAAAAAAAAESSGCSSGGNLTRNDRQVMEGYPGELCVRACYRVSVADVAVDGRINSETGWNLPAVYCIVVYCCA